MIEGWASNDDNSKLRAVHAKLSSFLPNERELQSTSVNRTRTHRFMAHLLDLRHYSPKTKRPRSSPSFLTSSGSFEERKRSASSRRGCSWWAIWAGTVTIRWNLFVVDM